MPERSVGEAFDLNIERVLEHWPVAYAVREFIANALDEHLLSGTTAPHITRLGEACWAIDDFGRGLRYEHLTQRENPEKLDHAAVIGQFGIGLKDALAVCDRRGVAVRILSPHGDITSARLPKAGFPDVVTLHAVVAPASEPSRTGTRVELSGVSAEDIAAAKSFFLRYSADVLLESTQYGDVYAKAAPEAAGRIYVKGLLVAEEPNFLFSYNVTKLNASLRRALNRERTNVGRSAYSDRVKDMLQECRAPEVARALADDLGAFAGGRMHDELSWKDVAVHACRVLHAAEDVIFVTPLQVGMVAVQYALDDGYRMVIVPEDIARKLHDTDDLDGNPILDLDRYQRQWNESFTFSFVDPEQLNANERATYALVDQLADLAGLKVPSSRVKEVKISETMRLNERGDQVLGLWDAKARHIVIRRDQLASVASFAGTLLHEFVHAATRTVDGTLAFEDALTTRLGEVARGALSR
ncbi:MAG: hypothetical protein QOK28_357 [Actinomycetota bacterium]|jgi:hypothetical protein